MKNLKQNKKGFSLVELIIAVAVLGIIVVPLLRTFVISQNMSTKAISYTQATMAAENILKTVEARSVSDFMNLNATDENSVSKKQLLSQMISANDDISFANGIDPYSDRIDSMTELVNDSKEFISVLKGVKSGTETYDAVVTFDRGVETDELSDGIREINDHKVAEYDKMDAVFCQPYVATSDPDKRAETELKAMAASKFGVAVDEEPSNKTRTININVYQDDPDDSSKITCYVEYSYYYYYHNTNSDYVTTTYTYAIFPGGYEYDGSLISIYVMYYPWTWTNKMTTADCPLVGKIYDNINVHNNESYEAPLNISTYLYMQEPDTITDKNNYIQNVYYYVPDSYELENEDENSEEEFNADTLIYTNAKNIGTFQLNVGNSYWERNDFNAKITGDMVKMKENKLMYNVTVEIYKSGAVTIDPDTNNISYDGDPIYTATGSKSQD